LQGAIVVAPEFRDLQRCIRLQPCNALFLPRFPPERKVGYPLGSGGTEERVLRIVCLVQENGHLHLEYSTEVALVRFNVASESSWALVPTKHVISIKGIK
jgi:hypothetical protein